MRKFMITVNGKSYEVCAEEIKDGSAMPVMPVAPVAAPATGAAMKMENEILAPKDGTIATVSATKGTSVKAGDALCAIQ